MKFARVVSLAVLVGLVAGGGLYAAAASEQGKIPVCSAIRASGGDFNGATGGQVEASIRAKNVGSGACTISGRPWIRLGPLLRGVTVADATPAVFGRNAGVPGRVLTLRPGQSAWAAILMSPGSCDRARWHVFGLVARVGWATKSVQISNAACKNGTAEIWVGSFQR